VEQHLRTRGLSDAQVARCFECATEDAGATNFDEIFTDRKELRLDRSI
jgi:hypothetical protein